MKKLVVYYSIGGNTCAVAKRIARSLRADLAEIKTVKSYPDDYDVLVSQKKRWRAAIFRNSNLSTSTFPNTKR